MADQTLDVQERTILGKKVKRLRKEGIVPLTVYGSNVGPLSLQAKYRALEVALMKAGGTSLIDLNIEGGNTHSVLAREVQRDVLKGTILHVDFFAIDAKVAIRADIPVNLVGQSPVVAAREGILLTGTNTVTIETLPGKLMDSIDVDLSKLTEIGDAITVADLDLGDGIIIINEPDEMLARVSQTSAARAQMLERMMGDEDEQGMGDAAGNVEVIGESDDK